MKESRAPDNTGSADTPSVAVSDAQLERINAHTRRALTAEEVYAFSLILCDNEVDRDGERFPADALKALGELFIGKTGVFDHAATAENQSARIFETEVERTDRPSSVGEPYTRLKAWAYMVRCDKNADLILEIDGGIKKEVSVSCSVERILCSVCGADQRAGGCAHKKGRLYDGAPCHYLLSGPTDAYEWSFVAVPAQRQAGVVKRRRDMQSDLPAIAPDGAALARLQRLAELGERYEKDLRHEVVKLGLLGQPELGADTLEQIAQKLDTGELEALRKSFSRAAAARYPIRPQLARPDPDGERDGGAFRI